MEDKTPIMESCNKSYGKKWLECMNVPPMPTGEDICALNSLYENSVNESSICQAIKEEFVTKYPSLTLEVSGSNGAEHSEL